MGFANLNFIKMMISVLLSGEGRKKECVKEVKQEYKKEYKKGYKKEYKKIAISSKLCWPSEGIRCRLKR